MIKKLQLASILIGITLLTTQGQNFSKEFEKIGKDEIELKRYAPDKDAEALVLFDIAKSYFVESGNSFDVVFERTTRIKVLSEAGIKWAEIEIPFYQEGGIYEKVYDIEAYTYNYENERIKKTPFNVSNTFDEKINNYWSVKKFAVPNVKVGSIIEYKYKINSQYKFNLRDWEFQWRIPVVYSEYEVKMIPFYEYSWLLQGANKFDIYESYQDKGMPRHFGSPGAYGDNSYSDMVYKYGMKNIPAFNDEEFISSINDYIIKLDFQLANIHRLNGSTTKVITAWDDLIKELLKHQNFGKYIKKSENVASKLINKESIEKKTDNEKFNQVLDYVKRNYNWDKRNDKFASKSPNKIVEDKHGNCADINLFTIGLLNHFGIEAYPLLLSTRDHGKIKYDYPYSHFFNYILILAKVDGRIVLSDATEIMSLNERIPIRCINDKGLIIKKDKVEWIGLECLFLSEIKTEILIENITNEVINTSVSVSSTEYDALYYRNYYTDKIEVVKKMLDSKDYSIIDSTISIQNQLNKEKPYILSYKQTSKPEIVNEKIYISPFLNEPISDNPLKQKERTYPVDMIFPEKRIYKTTISISDGYQVDFVPDDLEISNELFELNYSTKLYDNQIHVSFDYYFKRSVYPSNDYSKIKLYFNEIVKKGNEKIVLSKKSVEGLSFPENSIKNN